jgi:cyclopropane-fatty-acyl-phospholipid synthase
MLTSEVEGHASAPTAYTVEFPDGSKRVKGGGPPAFTFYVSDETQLKRILTADEYAAAKAFISGEFDLCGDLVSAIRFKRSQSQPGVSGWLRAAAARLAPRRIETWFQSKTRAADDIQFHYDRSNDFYRTFLDSRLVYSEARYDDPEWPLERAQEAKLQAVCRDLELRANERFLDVGCGWGALMLYAARQHNVSATGCTLSHSQFEYASAAIAAEGLGNQAKVLETDYRELSGRFHKIASIGMFEHVGRHRLDGYFRTIFRLLEDGGLFLNSGVTRPQTVGDDSQSWFLLKRVFPGAELAHLSDVVRHAESAGFEVLKTDSLRRDYALTCRAWVERLQRNAVACINLVGRETYRTWLLYLSASALSFETGYTGIHQVLMRKPCSHR